MEATPKISVIIPAYNAGAYIADAIQSVMAQKYENYEIIVIDDNSTDNTFEVAVALSVLDDRIRPIKQISNGRGVSDARNYGMTFATGDYVMFLDADDYYCNDLLFQSIVDTINQKEVDVINFGYVESNNRNQPKLSVANNGTIDMEFDSIVERTICLYPRESKDIRLRAASSWAKAYRMTFLKMYDVKFPSKILNSEDAIFNMRVLKHSPNVLVIDVVGYFYWNNIQNSGHRYMPEFYDEFDNTVSIFRSESSCFVKPSMERRKWLRIYSYIYKVINQYYLHPQMLCDNVDESLTVFINRPIVRQVVSHLNVSDFPISGKLIFKGINNNNIFMIKLGMIVFPKIYRNLRNVRDKFFHFIK